MLQRLLDRLQRRQRIVQLLLARQPMLRRTVVGRRMVRAYGPLLAAPVVDDRVAFAPNILPLPAEPQRTIPAVADLLPEPLIDLPAQSQATERPRAVTPPVVVRPSAPEAVSGPRQPIPAANPQIIPGPDLRQSAPQAARSQQQAIIPDPRSAAPPAQPVVGDAAAEQVPIPASGDVLAVAAPVPISALDQQAVPPDSTAPLGSGSLAPTPPIVPVPANSDPEMPSVPDPLPPRRRRAQITELPVAPEVARSLAQASGERYTPPPATTASERSGSVPAQKSADELFTSTPARSPQEWGRMLFGETNTAAPPTPAADPQPEPTVATEPAVADVVPAQTMLPTVPEQDEQVEFAANTRPVQPTQPTPIADPVIDAGIDLSSVASEQQAFTASDALREPASAPIPPVSVSGPSEPALIPAVSGSGTSASAPLPPVSVSGTSESASVLPVRAVQPLPSVPIAPSVALPSAPAPALPAADSPAPQVSAMQPMVERASEVLRNEAQAQPAQPYPAQPPTDPAMPLRANTASVSARADTTPTLLPPADSPPAEEGRASVQVPGSVAEIPMNDPIVQEPVASGAAAQSVADPASVLPPIGAPVAEEPTAPSLREQTPSRRSRFEEIPASARQPAPQPVAPSGERKLNPRPWIPQPPPEIPEMTNELFQEGGRSAQDWGRLLFEATNPNAWGRQQQPAATAQPQSPSVPDSPPAIDRPATIPSAQQPVQQPTQRQETNRPIAAQGDRSAPETAVPRRQSATAAQPQATPLRDSTRRFLRPIVGIDPGEVRIYRGAEGARMTEAFRAEGVSRGDEIALGPGNEDESRPETLGLLAHELTHAAQRTDPSFVPPIVAGVAGAVAPAASAEQVARAAERQAVGAARRFIAPIAAGAQVPIPAMAPVGNAPGEPSIPGTNSLFGAARSPQATPDRTHWGDLPAPWEPLPDWIGGPLQEPGMAPNTGSLPSAPNQALPGATVAASTAVPAVPATYLAEIDRDISEGEAVAPSEPQQQAAPAADLDAMARQVYGILKQRLAAERRRLGS